MSRLIYASIDEAFVLGSKQIQDTQEEIARLKTLISETSLAPPKPAPVQVVPPPVQSGAIPQEQVYQRIGPPPMTQAAFGERQQGNYMSDDLISQVIQHPRFDDIVKEYLKNKYPNNDLFQTAYVPPPTTKSNFGGSRSNFETSVPPPFCGNTSQFCGPNSFGEKTEEITQTLKFLIVALAIYLFVTYVT
jgi:hypothetical protein